MKKFLTSFALVALCSLSANAQDTTAQKNTSADGKYEESGTTNNSSSEREARRAKYQNASPEEKQKILQNRGGELDAKKAKIEEVKNKIEENQKKRDERYSNASPEEKARMDVIQKLSPQQKEAAKNERERHRQEMIKITGSNIW